MIFSSPIFLFSFLPFVLLTVSLLPKLRQKNLLLVFAGLICYAFGRVEYVLLLLGSGTVNYGLGLLLRQERFSHRRAVIALGVLGNLAVMFICRGIGIATGTLSGLLSIAIFSMKGMSYLLDVYRKETDGSEDLTEVLLYMSFFPVLPAGPMLPYGVFDQWLSERSVSAETAAAGLQRLIAGLGKKLLLGDPLGVVADTIFRECLVSGMDFRPAWLGCVCNALHLYFVLGGYSDMAIGICKMLGLHLPENFSYPFGAWSLKEFWNRWNLSLTAWLKKYLYRPMTVNRGRLSHAVAGAAMWLCVGMWHGVGAGFVLWGLLNGLLVMLEVLGVIPVKHLENHPVGRMVCRVYTVLAALLLMVLLRAETVQSAWTLISAMFRFGTSEQGLCQTRMLLSGATTAVLPLAAVLSVGTARGLSDQMQKTPMWVQDTYMICKRLGSVAVLVLSIMCLAQGNVTAAGYFGF